MIEGLAYNHPRYDDNAAKCSGGKTPCVICGKPVDVTKKSTRWVHVHEGGGAIVTEEEAAELNAAGKESWDMYFYPIGPDCKRTHPELAPYLTEEPQ